MYSALIAALTAINLQPLIAVFNVLLDTFQVITDTDFSTNHLAGTSKPNLTATMSEHENLNKSLTPSMPAVPNRYCLKCSAPYWPNPSVLIFDIRALWRSVLSARVPECQKSKLVGQTSMVKCKALMGSAVKGLKDCQLHKITPNETNAAVTCEIKLFRPLWMSV